MNVLMSFLYIAIMVPIFVSLMFIPYWTWKTESFGVSIPEVIYNSSELKRMRKQYTITTGIISVLMIALFWILSTIITIESFLSILMTAMIIFYLVIVFIVYLKFHYDMRKLKKNANWSKEKSELVVIHTAFREQQLTFSNLWYILPFIITLATMMITFQFYNQIPAKIPMQYNFSGEVTNWSAKSYRTVMIMPVMQFFLTAVFLFINIVISKSKQQISSENPEKSMKQNVIFRRRWSAFLIITGTALILMFSLIQLSFIFPVSQQVLMIVALLITFGTVAGAIVLSITTGQGGSRLKTSTDKAGQVIDRDDDRYWKLGQIYFNKNDPALFLEKRFGVGWTINFANPWAVISLVIIILLAVAIPLLLES